MYQYSNSLIRQFPSLVTGNAAVGIQATVYVGETNTLAQLFEVGGLVKSNPVTTDAKGFYSFSLADGDYRIVFSSSQFATLRISVLDGAQIREEFDDLVASNAAFRSEQQAAYDSFVLSQGWDQVGTFTAGFTYTSPNQVGQDADGNWWRWNGAFNKVVTAGTLPSSDANYKLVGDGVLRNELGNFFFTSDSLGSLIASVNSSFIDKKVQWLGYHTRSDGGSGWGIVKSGSYTADGGSIIAVGAGLYIEQNLSSGKVNVKKFGAKGDDTGDSYAAIMAAITWSKRANSTGRVIYVPSGVYRISQQILIDDSGIILVGDYEKGRVAGDGSLDYAGTDIVYHGTDGASVIKFSSLGGTVGTYHGQVKNLRVGFSGIGTKPRAGIEMLGVSEGTIENVHVNGACQAAFLIDTCSIMRIKNIDLAVNDIGIRFVNTISIPDFNGTTSVHISLANIWQCSIAGIQIESSLNFLSISDSWLEYCKDFIKVAQTADAPLFVGTIMLNKIQCSGGSGGPTNTRSIRVIAKDGSANPCFVAAISIKDCEFFNDGSPYNVEYTKGTNTSALSYIQNVTSEDCDWFGATSAAVYSDSGSCGWYFTGRQNASTGYRGGSPIPLAVGNLRQYSMIQKFGFWDMKEGYPIRLPGIPAISFIEAGQLFFDYGAGFMSFTDSSGSLRVVPRSAQSQADSSAADVAALRDDFNALLAKLRAALVILP